MLYKPGASQSSTNPLALDISFCMRGEYGHSCISDVPEHVLSDTSFHGDSFAVLQFESCFSSIACQILHGFAHLFIRLGHALVYSLELLHLILLSCRFWRLVGCIAGRILGS